MRKNSHLLLMLMVFACQPAFDSERIETDFSTEFPTYEFVSSDFDTNGDTTFVEVKFKKPTNDRIWVDQWKYGFDSNEWELLQTGKMRLIKPLAPAKNTTIRETLNQLKIRSIKIDSILFSADTLDFAFADYVATLIYHGDTLEELTYIPEGDSISIVYQRHLGNVHLKPYKYPGDTTNTP